MRWLGLAGALAASLSLTPAAMAQRIVDAEEARSRIPHYDAMKEAATRGREMYLYDQAAWHATDRFVEEFDMANSEMMRGYIVLPAENGRLDTVFFGEVDGKLVEVARYNVEGSRVVGGGLLDDDERQALSEVAMRMVGARQAAIDEMRAQSFGLCSNTTANTVVLPKEDGAMAVYILTPPTSNESYPIGGHYRFEVGADGKIMNSRRFLNTCYAADFGAMRRQGEADGARPEALVLTHLLDPQPTEIHVFASYYIPVMLMIATTDNGQMWSIRQGAVGYVGPLPESPGDRD